MEEKKHVYLDNSATTHISEAALNRYIEVSKTNYGNPSSLHNLGLSAENELKTARATVLSSLSANDSTVIFTASGSESNNLAIFGRAFAKERYRNSAKIITTMGEHASVSAPFEKLSGLGFKTAYIPTKNGEIDLAALEKEMTRDVVLVSVMMVNNETGALYDVKAVGDIMRRLSPQALLHVDATQSYMKIPFSKKSLSFDMITLSSHKIGGPKGVGALVIDNKIIKSKGLSPMVLGGGQEGGLRSGTENVPGIAAFSIAIEEKMKALNEDYEKTNALREYLIKRLSSDTTLAKISPTLPNLHAPHIINLTLPSVKSEVMLHYLSSLGIYVSSGSACSSNSSHLSSALISYGRTEKEADSSIRISFSSENTKDDVDALCEGLISGINKLAKMR